MSNNLPNPLPPGTVVFVPDGEPRPPQKDEIFKDSGSEMMYVANRNYNMPEHARQCYTHHVLTSPVHILDEGMVDWICDLVDASRDASARLHKHCEYSDFAFDFDDTIKRVVEECPFLNPPQETGKEADDPVTYDARMFMMLSSNLHPDYRKAMERLCDVLDAQQKSIDAIHARLAKEKP